MKYFIVMILFLFSCNEEENKITEENANKILRQLIDNANES